MSLTGRLPRLAMTIAPLPDMATMLDRMQVAAFILDVGPDETFTFRKMNAAGAAVIGIDAAAFSGRRPDEVLPPRVAEALVENYRTALRRGEAYCYDEYLSFARGESWWRTTITPLRETGREVTHLLGLAVHVSDEMRAEVERVAAPPASTADEAEAFVSIAAHDLRAPLRQIAFLADEIEAADEADRRDLLARLGGVVTRARRLIEEVLGYAEAARIAGDWRTLDLARFCGDIVGVLDPMKRFAVAIPELTLRIEPVALQVALRNLIDNAMRHGARHRIEVAVAAERGGPPRLRFEVRDDGPGFPDPTRACEPGRIAGGSGYGLATLRRIVGARGGAVSVANRTDGPGAAVAFTLPGVLVPQERRSRG
jgi:signal transduction histidine kinase